MFNVERKFKILCKNQVIEYPEEEELECVAKVKALERVGYSVSVYFDILSKNECSSTLIYYSLLQG